MSAKRTVFLLASALMPILAGADGAPAAPPAKQADPRTVHRVKTTADLLAAIGPDRVIELAPGEYDLGTVPRRRLKHVGWRNPNDKDYEPVIREVTNLAIRCKGDKPAHLFLGGAYATVLNFENCSKIELAGLKIGHWPKPGYCMGDVISGRNCKGVRIRGCTLYGCGTAGLRLAKVETLTFERSTIESCAYGIVDARDCDGLRFVDSRFRGNMQFYGFQLGDSGHVVFERCRVEGNSVGGALFDTTLSAPEERIRFAGGSIRRNGAKALAKPADMVALSGTKVEGNSWQAGPEAVAQRGKKTPLPGGGGTYCTNLGEASFRDVSFGVYRQWDQAEKLAEANPKLHEPLLPGTVVHYPPIHPPKPKPARDDDDF